MLKYADQKCHRYNQKHKTYKETIQTTIATVHNCQEIQNNGRTQDAYVTYNNQSQTAKQSMKKKKQNQKPLTQKAHVTSNKGWKTGAP